MKSLSLSFLTMMVGPLLKWTTLGVGKIELDCLAGIGIENWLPSRVRLIREVESPRPPFLTLAALVARTRPEGDPTMAAGACAGGSELDWTGSLSVRFEESAEPV